MEVNEVLVRLQQRSIQKQTKKPMKLNKEQRKKAISCLAGRDTQSKGIFEKEHTLGTVVAFFRGKLMLTLWSVVPNSTTLFCMLLKGSTSEGKGHRVPWTVTY